MRLAGYASGVALRHFLVFFGIAACCCNNCCGRSSIMRTVATAIMRSPPIMDMVQDRQQVKSFSILIFVLPFMVGERAHVLTRAHAITHALTHA